MEREETERRNVSRTIGGQCDTAREVAALGAPSSGAPPSREGQGYLLQHALTSLQASSGLPGLCARSDLFAALLGPGGTYPPPLKPCKGPSPRVLPSGSLRFIPISAPGGSLQNLCKPCSFPVQKFRTQSPAHSNCPSNPTFPAPSVFGPPPLYLCPLDL